MTATANALVSDLVRIVGADAVTDDPTDKSAYAHDLWPRQLLATRAEAPRPPGPRAVALPSNTEQLASIVQYARRTGARIVPYGAGSGVCGALSLTDDVIAVDTKRMRAIHAVDRARGTATVDAGILGTHLEEKLQRRGVTLGHFPSSISCSTLGGWLATRGAGQCSGRYGKIEDMALALEGVLPTGEAFRATAPPVGAIDPRALFVGSEGLFGFITAATMRVWPAPREHRFLAYGFDTIERAADAIRAVYQSGLRPAVSRLYDPFDAYIYKSGRRAQHEGPSQREGEKGRKKPLTEFVLRHLLDRPRALNALNERFGRVAFGRALLLLLFEASHDEHERSITDEAHAKARALCVAQGGVDEGDELAQRWLSRRHSVSYRQPPLYQQGVWVDTMEVAAPWSKLFDLYHAVGHALGRGGFVMAHMSHAYPDGCSIYFTFAGADPSDRHALETYDQTWRAALCAAHESGGTVAHHHGVGRHKRSVMRLELGPGGVRTLDALARAADPDGVIARGPLVPDAHEGPHPTRSVDVVSARAPVYLDENSRLATVYADADLATVHARLASAGLSLDAPRDTTVRAWLAAARAEVVHEDPVDHRVAGYTARTVEGSLAREVPAPRRSTGPALFTLFAQGGARFGALETVTLRVHKREENPRFLAPCVPEIAGERTRDEAVEAWLARARLGAPEGPAR